MMSKKNGTGNVLQNKNTEAATPSPHGTGDLLTCDNMSAVMEEVVTVTIHDVRLKKKDWEKFQSLVMLSPRAKQEFISDSVQFRIEELLYENPELFSEYAGQHA